MTLAKQINKWYQAGEHQETVNAILNMAEMEVTDNLIEDLAVAYNNLGQYQKAVEALKNTGFQNRTSPHWHYCMGYALYYAAMDSPGFKKQKALLEGAFHAFSCALKLQPEKNLAHECREFLSWIEDDLQKPDSPPYDMEQEGGFVCSILFSTPWFDTEKFAEDFHRDWSLPITPTDTLQPDHAGPKHPSAVGKTSPSLLFSVDGMDAILTLIPSPVPGQEARDAAMCNYLWPNASKVVNNHRAHLIISVLGPETSLISRGLLLVKLAATCCLQLPAIGVFTGPAVYQIGLYRNLASVIKNGRLPVFNWVWLGLYKTERGYGGYTYGLNLFGKDEIEVVDSPVKPNRLRAFLASAASCVLEDYAVFEEGDHIDFSGHENLSVTFSQGVALRGKTIKISYT